MRAVRTFLVVALLVAVAAVAVASWALVDVRSEHRRTAALQTQLAALRGAPNVTADVADLSSRLASTTADVEEMKRAQTSATSKFCDDKRVSVEVAQLDGASSAQATYTRYFSDLVDLIDVICGRPAIAGASGG